MKTEFAYCSSNNRTKIHAVKWMPQGEPRGVLQISHGMTEYISRYDEIAEYFCSQNLIVCGNDHLGHGDSLIDGKRMYFGEKGSWNNVVEDMKLLYDIISQEYPTLPKYLLGFSLGSFLSRDYISRYPDDFKSVILAGTGNPDAVSLSIAGMIAKSEAKKQGYDSASPLIQKLTFEDYNKSFKPNRTNMDWLCENQSVLDKYIDDERRGKYLTCGMFVEFVDGMKKVGRSATVNKMNRNAKILLISGESDPVGDFTKGVKRTAALFGKKKIPCKIKFYPGRHDILRESSSAQVLNDISDFLDII